MRIVEPSVLLLRQPDSRVDALRHVERCGRVCYKSEGKITDDSYKGFIERIVQRGHEAVLEHGYLIVRFDSTPNLGWFTGLQNLSERNGKSLYLTSSCSISGVIVSGNFRAWRNALWQFVADEIPISRGLVSILERYSPVFTDLLRQIRSIDDGRVIQVYDWMLETDREIQTHVRRTLWFTCDRGVSHELVRHRPASYCQESTRYCNYLKDDFSSQITVIKPCFFTEGTIQYDLWRQACEAAEKAYFDLLTQGDCTPQQARSVLPNSLKTEVAMTATIGEWLHFLRLRCSSAAHPQMREVATRAKVLLVGSLPRMEEWL